MKTYTRGLWCCLLVILSVGAKPLSEAEKQLVDTDFAYHELGESDFDKAYFLPNNAQRALKVVRGLIAGTKKHIRAAFFRLTEPSIARALIDAHKRGVQVEVVVDPGALEAGHYSKVRDLVKAGIAVYCYQTSDLFALSKDRQDSKGNYQTIMHLKVVSGDAGDQKFISSGSLNWTHAGLNGNVEIVEIRSKEELIEDFEEHFESLKRCSELLTLEELSKRKGRVAPKVQEKTTPLIVQGTRYMSRVLRQVAH